MAGLKRLLGQEKRHKKRKSKSKNNSSGQECPLYMGTSDLQDYAVRMSLLSGSRGRHRECDCAVHNSLEGSLELLHFFTSTDSDADARRHDRPDASDEDILLGHRVDHLFSRPPGIKQEAIRRRGGVGVAVAVEPLKKFPANVRLQLPALRNTLRPPYP